MAIVIIIMQVKTLAALLKKDATETAAEIKQHKPIALRIFQETQCSTEDAWRMAISRTQATAKLRERYPVENLTDVLIADIVLGSGTSGVEQGFAVKAATISPQQLHGKGEYLEDIMRLVHFNRQQQRNSNSNSNRNVKSNSNSNINRKSKSKSNSKSKSKSKSNSKSKS